MLDLKHSLVYANVPHDFLITGNESLITRARNTSVARFLKTDFTHFMFIDADIQFKAEDVMKLFNLDADVAVAAYPMKRPEAGVTAWVNGKLADLDSLEGPTKVDYAGTGFMMIKRHVFEKLKEDCSYHEEGKVGDCWNFFETNVVDDGSGPFYCSEDYWFCRSWRKYGDIILDPSIRLGHVGRKIYV